MNSMIVLLINVFLLLGFLPIIIYFRNKPITNNNQSTIQNVSYPSQQPTFYSPVQNIAYPVQNNYFPQEISKGALGELIVLNQLNRLPKDRYTVLNNVMINTDHGTSQIDHIVVSIFGVFVIETKNYSGLILGKDTDDYWFQYMNKTKNKFRNPLFQNYGHVKAIQQKLGYFSDDKINIIPIIAFSDDCKLSTKCKNGIVLRFSNVIDYIWQFNYVTISIENMNRIAHVLIANNIDNEINRIEHEKSIKNKIYAINEMVASGICPKCNARLIQREGKYGIFTSCSNYPKCRYIVKE